MRSFTEATIRAILSASSDYEDQRRLFNYLCEDQDNVNQIIGMLVAESHKVASGKGKVFFAVDTWNANRLYRFVCNDSENRKLIDCIKLVRALTLLGLKEAKDLVEGKVFSGYSPLFYKENMAAILGFGFHIENAQ